MLRTGGFLSRGSASKQQERVKAPRTPCSTDRHSPRAVTRRLRAARAGPPSAHRPPLASHSFWKSLLPPAYAVSLMQIACSSPFCSRARRTATRRTAAAPGRVQRVACMATGECWRGRALGWALACCAASGAAAAAARSATPSGAGAANRASAPAAAPAPPADAPGCSWTAAASDAAATDAPPAAAW